MDNSKGKDDEKELFEGGHEKSQEFESMFVFFKYKS